MGSHILSMKLVVLSFKVVNIYNVYCPSLNLVGCGCTQEEADNSFRVVFEEYIRDTTDNKTLIKDLESLGWNIKGEKPIPPNILESVKIDKELENIFNNYDFVKHSISVEIPFV